MRLDHGLDIADITSWATFVSRKMPRVYYSGLDKPTDLYLTICQNIDSHH